MKICVLAISRLRVFYSTHIEYLAHMRDGVTVFKIFRIISYAAVKLILRLEQCLNTLSSKYAPSQSCPLWFH